MKSLTEKDEKRELEFVMMCLAIVCGSGVLTEVLRTLLLAMDCAESTVDGWKLLMRSINLAVSVVCGVLIVVIMREVKHRRVFTRKNANLVGTIGAVTVLGSIVVNLAYRGTEHADGDMTFLIIGLFILFISCLFKIGIRMKEEQELTV